MAARLGAHGVVDDARATWSCSNWAFNAWAKYDNWRSTRRSAAADRAHHGPAATSRCRTDTGERIVLEGGGIEVNGHGLLLVTEEWLLSDVQVRNPG